MTTTLKTTKEQREAILRASDRDIIRGSHQFAFIPHSDLKDLCHDADRAEELEKENDVLRGLLGNSAKDCPYYGLPAKDQGRCDRGFPGCARADDQQLHQFFADNYRAEMCEKEVSDLRAKLDEAQNSLRYFVGHIVDRSAEGSPDTIADGWQDYDYDAALKEQEN